MRTDDVRAGRGAAHPRHRPALSQSPLARAGNSRARRGRCPHISAGAGGTTRSAPPDPASGRLRRRQAGMAELSENGGAWRPGPGFPQTALQRPSQSVPPAAVRQRRAGCPQPAGTGRAMDADGPIGSARGRGSLAVGCAVMRDSGRRRMRTRHAPAGKYAGAVSASAQRQGGAGCHQRRSVAHVCGQSEQVGKPRLEGEIGSTAADAGACPTDSAAAPSQSARNASLTGAGWRCADAVSCFSAAGR